MAKTVTARERIYISCRAIFSGRHANIREEEKVEHLVNKNQASLATPLADISRDKVIDTIRSLLELGVFESEARARLEFPKLFCSSRLHDIQRENSEDAAAASVAERLEEIVPHEGTTVKEEEQVTGFESSDNEVRPETSVSRPARQEQGELFDLYPSYLPFRTQHLLLNTAKQVLENCCFDFARDSMPHILREKQWRRPADADLTEWMFLFGNDKIQVHAAALKLVDKSLLTQIAALSRVVLKELPIPARVVSRLLESATQLSRTLQCVFHTTQLGKLHVEVDSKIRVMELNKDYLKHAALKRLRKEEKRLAEDISTKDQHNQSQVGQLLVDSADEIFGVQRDVDGRVPWQL